MAIFSLGLSILFSLAIFFVYSPLKPVLGLTHELNQTAIKGQFDKGKYFEFTNVVTDYKKTDTSNHLTVFGAVKSNSPQNFKNVLLGLEVYNKQNALIYFVSEPIFYEDNAGGNSIFNFNVEINPSLEYDHYNLLVAAEPLVGFGLNHTNAQESITLVNYTDHQRNFMLQYPSDWNFTQRDDGSVLFHPILDTSKDKMLGMFKLAAFGPKITISLTNPLFPDMTSEELCNSYANFFENAGCTVYHKGEKILPTCLEA
jgi:hypothetical protein